MAKPWFLGGCGVNFPQLGFRPPSTEEATCGKVGAVRTGPAVHRPPSTVHRPPSTVHHPSPLLPLLLLFKKSATASPQTPPAAPSSAPRSTPRSCTACSSAASA